MSCLLLCVFVFLSFSAVELYGLSPGSILSHCLWEMLLYIYICLCVCMYTHTHTHTHTSHTHRSMFNPHWLPHNETFLTLKPMFIVRIMQTQSYSTCYAAACHVFKASRVPYIYIFASHSLVSV